MYTNKVKNSSEIQKWGLSSASTPSRDCDQSPQKFSFIPASYPLTLPLIQPPQYFGARAARCRRRLSQAFQRVSTSDVTRHSNFCFCAFDIFAIMRSSRGSQPVVSAQSSAPRPPQLTEEQSAVLMQVRHLIPLPFALTKYWIARILIL